MIDKNSKIYIAGHRGLVGSAIHRLLIKEGYKNIITKTSSELDLRNQDAVNMFIHINKPDYVFMCAAKVGGIKANNDNKGDFIYDNLMINTNLLYACKNVGVKKLLFLGSSCIYPKNCPQPIKEEYLLDGKLEPTNDAYAISKIAGIKTCQSFNEQYSTNFISVMPTNLYGPNDNYDLENSHVLPALLKKTHLAKEKGLKQMEIWGDGTPLREFLHVDDLADACLFLMKNYDGSEIINVGSSYEVSIARLANIINKVVGWEGNWTFDESKPNGTMRKIMDSSKIRTLGWDPKIGLEEGIRRTYSYALTNNELT